MRGLRSLASRTRPVPDDDVRVVDIEAGEGGNVLDALGSETTREVFEAVRTDPRTATGVSDEVETSLQNAKYHLEKLERADLVEVADTWYSAQGNEMDVYAPTSDALVLFAGPEESKSALGERLPDVIAAILALTVGAVAVERIARVWNTTYASGGRPRLPAWIPANAVAGGPSPGVAFVLGGLTVLIALAVSSSLRQR